MDSKRFDALAKSVGSGTSRRRALKSLVAGAFGLAGVSAGIDRANAARLRSIGNSCNTNADCASNLCVAESPRRKICHCASPADCPAPTGVCQQAACLASGYCGASVSTGAPCDDGDACTVDDVCLSNGVCAGTAVSCPANEHCSGGACVCDGDQCNGSCCAAGHTCGSDNVCSGSVALGDSCTLAQDCASGACCSGTGGSTCTDTNTDSDNCGSCGNICPRFGQDNFGHESCGGGGVPGVCACVPSGQPCNLSQNDLCCSLCCTATGGALVGAVCC